MTTTITGFGQGRPKTVDTAVIDMAVGDEERVELGLAILSGIEGELARVARNLKVLGLTIEDENHADHKDLFLDASDEFSFFVERIQARIKELTDPPPGKLGFIPNNRWILMFGILLVVLLGSQVIPRIHFG